jgi:hypothetical protein
MRHRKTLHFDVEKAETGARLKYLPIGPVAQAFLHRFRGRFVGEDLQALKFFQAIYPRGMVAVLMSEEDGVDPRERFPEIGEQVLELSG